VKTTATAIFLLICAALSTTVALAAQPVLHVANWNDYIDPDVIQLFEAEFKVKVEYTTYASSEEAKALLDGEQPLDVLVTAFEMLPEYIKDGKLRGIGAKDTDAYKQADPRILARLSAKDGLRDFAVPYLWGNIGIAMNREKVEQLLGGPAPSSWALLFEKEYADKLSSCGVSILDSQNDVTSIYMNYRGISMLDLTPMRTHKLMGKLDDVSSNYTYIDSEKYVEDLVNGNLCLAMSWVGDAIAAKEAGQPIEFFVPKEGSVTFMDVLVVTERSTQVELGKKFIEFVTTEENSKRISRYTYYMTPNAKAHEEIIKDDKFATMAAVKQSSVFTFIPTKEASANVIAQYWKAMTSGT
jgi:putrescine transport system substrate-binding protein